MPSRSNEEELKNLLVMCSLSAVCILGDPSATLGMTYRSEIFCCQKAVDATLGITAAVWDDIEERDILLSEGVRCVTSQKKRPRDSS